MRKIILILILPLIGCSSTKTEPNIEKRFYDLLYLNEYDKIAYKSITIKDIIKEDYN